MKYSHVFFDLDRTLWDFEKNTEETLREIYDRHFLRLYFTSFFDFHSQYKAINEKQWDLYRQGKITKDFLRANRFYLTLKEAGVDDLQLADRIGTDYIELTPGKTALYPHSHEILSLLKEKYKLYILTNGFREVQHAKVTGCKLTPYFKEVITSEDAGFMKPDIRFFSYVLNKLKVMPENCIMIGDDLKVDIMGAQNAGIDSIYFNHDSHPHSEKPTFEIRSLDQIAAVL
jgi:putative hydrolase of the HAD superfamily